MHEHGLSFSVLLKALQDRIEQLDDPRQPSNATLFSIQDIVLGAFSVFYLQCPSFLEHQRQLQSRHGQDNAQHLFGLADIPTARQIKNVLDSMAAKLFFPLFFEIFRLLLNRGSLEQYKVLNGQWLIGLDGSEYFRSKNLSCPQCSTQTHRDGSTSYFHKAVLPVLVAPDCQQVISLPPEFIRPQDGATKQDSETAASKRWLKAHAQSFEGHNITILGDDLYSRQPMVKCCLANQWNFIFVCLPSSHPELYDWVTYFEGIGAIHTVEIRRWNGRYHEIGTYRYCHDIPLREAAPAQRVNWIEVTMLRAADGKQMYHNAFITYHPITERTVVDLVRAGRSRWKGENEGHNVLKTKGYHLDHNFGHGQAHLSMTLLTLNLLAFLFHTALHLVDASYQRIRQKRRTRQGFFNDVKALTQYFIFDSWDHLVLFMLGEADLTPAHNSS